MILVTGGAGFIGSNLVAALAERGERVVVCDWLKKGDKWRNLAKHELEEIVAPENLDHWLSTSYGVTAVIHMGAISATTERDGDALVENNLNLSQKLWRWCVTNGTPFIYASSAATYGDGSHGFDDCDSRAHQAKLRPLNGYGWSKHLFDRWVARRLELGHIAPPLWAGLKFFNVYGPNEQHKQAQASVPLHLFNQISSGENARLFQSHHPDYEDGGQLRDFIWVGDVVKVVLWLLDSRQTSGLFNVGTGKARSFHDLARAVFKTMGKPENIEFIPTPEALRAKYQYFTEANMARLHAAGYDQPFTSLEDGIGQYLRDYLMTDDPHR
jgi:ADP-L-glycero-D-manno-heptose 6-epimerase|tara:strand:- start:1082 stop:2062 length:981 start_codon:yes stop_codon:yes gene_type:complete